MRIGLRQRALSSWRISACMAAVACCFVTSILVTPKLPEIQQSHKPPNVRFLFITSRFDNHTAFRVGELREALGDTLLVVWDNANVPQCPYATTMHCIDETDQKVSTKPHFNYFGGGLERAAMWSIAHRNEYDYIWYMEDDVAYTEISQIVQLLNVSSDDTSDLLSQTGLESAEEENWFWYNEIMEYQLYTTALENTTMVHTMLNLYRLSRNALSTLEAFYYDNHHSWFFFEAMIPTLVQHQNLTAGNFSAMVDLYMRFRPCYTSLEAPGIYHPVKFDDDGAFRECYD